jgi:hypothetical protein
MSIQTLCRGGGPRVAVRTFASNIVTTAIGAGSPARAGLTSIARYKRHNPQSLTGAHALIPLGHGAVRLQMKARLVLEIVIIYGVTRLQLGRNSLKPINHMPSVDPRRGVGLSTEQTAAFAAYLSFAVVRVLGWLPIHSSCLVRSLVLLRLLSRWGVGSCLVIGVRYKDNSLAAHAWVEHCGIPLLDSGGGEFARLLQREATTDEQGSTMADTAMRERVTGTDRSKPGSRDHMESRARLPSCCANDR